jgi:hypothetical protein
MFRTGDAGANDIVIARERNDRGDLPLPFRFGRIALLNPVPCAVILLRHERQTDFNLDVGAKHSNK